LKKKGEEDELSPLSQEESADEAAAEFQAALEAELEALLNPAPAYEATDTTRTPSGLYPHEILLLDAAPGLFTDQVDFPVFWRQQYGILNLSLSLVDLVGRGFLTAASIKTTLEGQTVAALKQGLKSLGLPVGGRKAELIERLLSKVSETELGLLFPRRPFALTSSGLRALDEAMHISYIHRRPVEDMTIWSLHRQVQADPSKSYREHVWEHLETQSKLHKEAEDFAADRACRYRMYQFLMEEQKRKRAFALLSEVIYYDLSGAANGSDPLHRYISEKYFFPYDKSIVKLTATCVSAMGQLQTDLNLTEEMLKALLMQFFGQYKLPFHLFSVEECAIIVLLELRGDKERLRQSYDLAAQRFAEQQ